MKRTCTLLAFLWISFASFSQTSDKGYSFQGYAIDPDGKALGATAVTIQFSISPSTGTGKSYSETQSLTTDAFGVFHAIVGKGSKNSGSDDFKTLDYSRSGTIYKMKVEVKKTAGGIYTTINESDFNAVPYARKAENGVPVGTIVSFAGPKSKVPEGWAVCDGSQKDGSSSDWVQLYEAIGTSWGGSGSTFYLPDLRGMFLRGVNDTRTDGYRDPDAGSRASFRTGANSGDAVGAVQLDATSRPNSNFTTTTDGSHTHTFTDGGFGGESNCWGSGSCSGGVYLGVQTNRGNTTDGAGNHNHSVSGGGDNETRPSNAGVYYIIKY